MPLWIADFPYVLQLLQELQLFHWMADKMKTILEKQQNWSPCLEAHRDLKKQTSILSHSHNVWQMHQMMRPCHPRDPRDWLRDQPHNSNIHKLHNLACLLFREEHISLQLLARGLIITLILYVPIMAWTVLNCIHLNINGKYSLVLKEMEGALF